MAKTLGKSQKQKRNQRIMQLIPGFQVMLKNAQERVKELETQIADKEKQVKEQDTLILLRNQEITKLKTAQNTMELRLKLLTKRTLWERIINKYV